MATTHTPHLSPRPEWLALHAEPAMEPDLPIVDAHHHLWQHADGGRYLLPELLEDLDTGHRVVATVYVECRTMYRAWGPPEMRAVGEVEFANGIAAQAASGLHGPRWVNAGIVGLADLTLGDAVEPVLDAMVRAGGGRLRGVRNRTTWHPDEAVRTNATPNPQGLLGDARYRAGVRVLGRLGLSLDVWAYHTQLPEVVDLARACPGTTIVVDHVGGPLGVGRHAGRRDETFADWQASIAELARLPNVVMKLGGLAMRIGGWTFHEAPLPPTSAELAEAWRPWIATSIERFGASRCMFESNFPVDKGSCSYNALWNAFKRVAAGASAGERAALFHDTAARVYKIA